MTGGGGFIGSHLVKELISLGASVKVADLTRPSENWGAELEWISTDLAYLDNAIEACKGTEVVLNLAANVAGVAFNARHPGDMFRKNCDVGLSMLEAARKTDISRFLVVSSACVYRRNSTVPTPETEGFIDDPEQSNLGYGWAKRVLETQARMYYQEYGMRISIVRPFNTYGPRDHFDLETGHVIPSLIKKVIDGPDPVVVWGDGKQTRSFVYVSDVVSGMLLASEKYPVADPVNIGSDEEISIAELARLIVDQAGSGKNLVFDITKPSGQPRRTPDLSKAKEKLSFQPLVNIREGLKRTIEWYEALFEVA